MRMTRTGQYMETITFGTRTEARRMAARVRGHAPAALRRRGDDRPGLPGRRPGSAALGAHCAVDSLLSTARRAGVPLSDEDADAYVAEQVAAARLVGRAAERRARTVAELDAYFERIRPALAVTPAASGRRARLIVVPPMKGWVQVLTPARPAWGTLASLGVRDAAAVGAADVLDARASA